MTQPIRTNADMLKIVRIKNIATRGEINEVIPDELIDSIKTLGWSINPIIVMRTSETEDTYKLIYGRVVLEAIKLAGYTRFHAIVLDSEDQVHAVKQQMKIYD